MAISESIQHQTGDDPRHGRPTGRRLLSGPRRRPTPRDRCCPRSQERRGVQPFNLHSDWRTSLTIGVVMLRVTLLAWLALRTLLH